jgi:hypothetical protein
VAIKYQMAIKISNGRKKYQKAIKYQMAIHINIKSPSKYQMAITTINGYNNSKWP